MIAERKQRKFLETVELQVGLRDYDPDKRFNGSVRLPHQSHNKVKVISFWFRSVFWPMLSIFNKLKLTKSLTSMSMVSRPLTRTELKSRNGLKNMMFCWPLIQLQSKSPNFWAMSWLKWINSQLPWLKEKNSWTKSKKLSIQSNSNQRRLLV